MPRSFNTIFFSGGQDTYRLHFPYILDGVEKNMLSNDNGGKFTSDTREYFINGFTSGNASFDVYVKESGADIRPGRIDAWFVRGGKVAPIPLDLLANIMMRNEEATQNKIAIYINGKQV
jgi:hypothetical protein